MPMYICQCFLLQLKAFLWKYKLKKPIISDCNFDLNAVFVLNNNLTKCIVYDAIKI